MKIYDKKMFWESVLGFLAVMLLLKVMKIWTGNDRTLWAPVISTFIISARGVFISLSRERVKEHNLQQSLYKIATENIFGKYGKIAIWGWAVLLLLSVMVLGYSLKLSIVFFALAIVYILWYTNTVEKEANRLRYEMESIENSAEII